MGTRPWSCREERIYLDRMPISSILRGGTKGKPNNDACSFLRIRNLRKEISRTPKSWQYIPFNGGPRICIGQQFALTEIGYTLVRLFQEFEVVESRETGEQWVQTEIVGAPGAGVKVSFRPVAK